MFNPQMLMQMIQGGKANPQMLMGMLGNNPMFQQAQKMIQSGGNPQEIINNVIKEKGIDVNQAKQMAQQLGLKL